MNITYFITVLGRYLENLSIRLRYHLKNLLDITKMISWSSNIKNMKSGQLLIVMDLKKNKIEIWVGYQILTHISISQLTIGLRSLDINLRKKRNMGLEG